jgi:signal transduction histidine kinase
VFERFRQADRTATRTVGGLGLGLFIARRLVDAHGGHIRVESDGENRGATFTVSLPLSDNRQARPRTPETKPVQFSDASSGAQPRRAAAAG